MLMQGKILLAAAALCAALTGWALLERAGRINAGLREQAVRVQLAQAMARIENMEVRHEEDDRAARDADPVGSLRDRWSRD